MKPTKAKPDMKKAVKKEEWKMETSAYDKKSDAKQMKKGGKAC